MGCELSKSAKGKAPKYKTYHAKNAGTPAVRPPPSVSVSPKAPSSIAVSLRSERDQQELTVEHDRSTSSRTELLPDPMKTPVWFDDIRDLVVVTKVPADHILEEENLPVNGPLEHLPKSMFDDEVLIALATFEREHMLRKDFEFEAILAQVQDA
jgi:hypothetical protein